MRQGDGRHCPWPRASLRHRDGGGAQTLREAFTSQSALTHSPAPPTALSLRPRDLETTGDVIKPCNDHAPTLRRPQTPGDFRIRRASTDVTQRDRSPGPRSFLQTRQALGLSGHAAVMSTGGDDVTGLCASEFTAAEETAGSREPARRGPGVGRICACASVRPRTRPSALFLAGQRWTGKCVPRARTARRSTEGGGESGAGNRAGVGGASIAGRGLCGAGNCENPAGSGARRTGAWPGKGVSRKGGREEKSNHVHRLRKQIKHGAPR